MTWHFASVLNWILRCCISTHISQGSAATDLRWGENFNKFLAYSAISCWIYQWKNYENPSIFARVIEKIKVSRFYGPQCSIILCDLEKFILLFGDIYSTPISPTSAWLILPCSRLIPQCSASYSLWINFLINLSASSNHFKFCPIWTINEINIAGLPLGLQSLRGSSCM